MTGRGWRWTDRARFLGWWAVGVLCTLAALSVEAHLVW